MTASRIDDWAAALLSQSPPRSKSLIVTVFGDAIAPHGGAVWLSGLIQLLAAFGINDRQARTSVFRLAEEGWLESRREGRRSLYRLTPSGMRRIEHATRRIYRSPPKDWDGTWTLVLFPRSASATAERAELRKELRWEGFGLVAPGLYARPATDAPVLDEILRRLQLRDTVFTMAATDLPQGGGRPTRELIGECWDLADLAAGYRRFIDCFEPLAAGLRGHRAPAPAEAFVAQTLVIHEYRRVILHDPQFPAELLPADWPGHRAYALCREIYARTLAGAMRHLRASVEGPEGALPAMAPHVAQRFGGLAIMEAATAATCAA